MTKYEDSYISFDIPEEFVCTPVADVDITASLLFCGANGWRLIGKDATKNIIITPLPPQDRTRLKEFEFELDKNREIAPMPLDDCKVSCREPFIFEGNEILVTELVTKCPPHQWQSKSLQIYFLNDTCCYKVIINDFKKVFETDIYLPFVKSIQAKGYPEIKFDEIGAMRFNLPEGFVLKPYQDGSGMFELYANGKSIEIYDITEQGRDADIAMFEERQKNGETSDFEIVIKIGRNKALIRNGTEHSLDFTRCRSLDVLLATKTRCFGILFKFDAPFDINEYMSFLRSIDKKSAALHSMEQT